MHKHQEAGFSLLELLVILTIVIILTLLSIPLFSTLIQNQRATGAAETLFHYLQFAKSEAIKQNASVYVSFNTGDEWCYGLNLNSTCDCSVSNCSIATVNAGNEKQLSLTISGMSSNSIYFDGVRGTASSSSTATFTVYGGTNLLTITIGRLGGIQLCATGISGYTVC